MLDKNWEVQTTPLPPFVSQCLNLPDTPLSQLMSAFPRPPFSRLVCFVSICPTPSTWMIKNTKESTTNCRNYQYLKISLIYLFALFKAFLSAHGRPHYPFVSRCQHFPNPLPPPLVADIICERPLNFLVTIKYLWRIFFLVTNKHLYTSNFHVTKKKFQH